MIEEIINSIFPISVNSINEIDHILEIRNFDKGEVLSNDIREIQKNILYLDGATKTLGTSLGDLSANLCQIILASIGLASIVI